MSYKIAITGAGGGVGQSIIKSLYNTDYELIAMDGDVLGTGLYAVSNSYLIPYANKSNYITVLLEICKKEKIDLLFPGMDAELLPLTLNKDLFKAIGTTVIVSELNVVELSNNKQLMYDHLKSLGVNIPFTMPLSKTNIEQIEFPIIIKQMIDGARSKNVFLVRNATELKNVLSEIGDNWGNFIIQEYIEGDEYTCGTISLNNECKGVIIMRRVLRDGDTYKCFTEENTKIEESVRKIINTILPFGACNVQLRLKSGIPYIFEINARCSGTTAARTLCGFNEPLMIANYLLKGIEPHYNVEKKSILRFWKELEVENSQIEELKNIGYLSNEKYTNL